MNKYLVDVNGLISLPFIKVENVPSFKIKEEKVYILKEDI